MSGYKLSFKQRCRFRSPGEVSFLLHVSLGSYFKLWGKCRTPLSDLGGRGLWFFFCSTFRRHLCSIFRSCFSSSHMNRLSGGTVWRCLIQMMAKRRAEENSAIDQGHQPGQQTSTQRRSWKSKLIYLEIVREFEVKLYQLIPRYIHFIIILHPS